MYTFIINGENVPELGKEVFQCMDFETLMKCRQVSTEWCDHIDSFLWDRLSKTEDRPDKPFLPNMPQISDWEKIDYPRILLLLKSASSKEKRIQIARLYLRHAKDKNPKSVRGNTLLHEFAIIGDTELFELFFEEAEDKNPRGFGDRTPLHHAASYGRLDICQMIVDNVEDKRPLDSSGTTPLHWARMSSSIVTDMSYNPNRQAIIDLLEPFEP